MSNSVMLSSGTDAAKELLEKIPENISHTATFHSDNWTPYKAVISKE